jgi:glycosyltransferase involved in cell wall biosynthesis
VRILFLSQLLPYPLDAGAKVRSYYVLRHLAERGHDVSLCVFVRPSDRPADVDHLRSVCRAVSTVPMVRSRLRDVLHLLRTWRGEMPFTLARDWLADMRGVVRGLVTSTPSFDAVHADQLNMALYALWARRWASRPPVTVLDQHNATFQVPARMALWEASAARRVLLRRESRRLLAFEQRMVAEFDHVVWLSDDDRRALARHARAGDRAGTVIPIAVDPAERSLTGHDPHPFRVTFVGPMKWPPNADAAHWLTTAVWPRVRARVPGARLTFIGECPPAMAERFRRAGVDVAGYVRDLTAAPYLPQTAVFVVPIRAGAGVRVKILDAWSWGLPVVSTRLGAEGLDAREGDNLLLADDEAGFARAVAEVAERPDLRARLVAGGRRTLEQHHHWRTAYAAWDAVYAGPSREPRGGASA